MLQTDLRTPPAFFAPQTAQEATLSREIQKLLAERPLGLEDLLEFDPAPNKDAETPVVHHCQATMGPVKWQHLSPAAQVSAWEEEMQERKERLEADFLALSAPFDANLAQKGRVAQRRKFDLRHRGSDCTDALRRNGWRGDKDRPSLREKRGVAAHSVAEGLALIDLDEQALYLAKQAVPAQEYALERFLEERQEAWEEEMQERKERLEADFLALSAPFDANLAQKGRVAARRKSHLRHRGSDCTHALKRQKPVARVESWTELERRRHFYSEYVGDGMYRGGTVETWERVRKSVFHPAPGRDPLANAPTIQEGLEAMEAGEKTFFLAAVRWEELIFSLEIPVVEVCDKDVVTTTEDAHPIKIWVSEGGISVGEERDVEFHFESAEADEFGAYKEGEIFALFNEGREVSAGEQLRNLLFNADPGDDEEEADLALSLSPVGR